MVSDLIDFSLCSLELINSVSSVRHLASVLEENKNNS